MISTLRLFASLWRFLWCFLLSPPFHHEATMRHFHFFLCFRISGRILKQISPRIPPTATNARTFIGAPSQTFSLELFVVSPGNLPSKLFLWNLFCETFLGNLGNRGNPLRSCSELLRALYYSSVECLASKIDKQHCNEYIDDRLGRQTNHKNDNRLSLASYLVRDRYK